MSNLELLDRAAGQTTCQILGIAGESLVGTGVVSFALGGVGLIPFTAGAATLLAANYLCPDMELGDAPGSGIAGCQKVDGTGRLFIDFGNGPQEMYGPGSNRYQMASQAIEILAVTQSGLGSNGKWIVYVEWSWTGGTTGSADAQFSTEQQARECTFSLVANEGSACINSDPQPKPPPEAFDPIPYTDPVTNCNYTVQLQGFAEEQPGGVVQPVYLIEGVTEERAGGRMGGCNFPPTIYSPGFGGGGRQIPVPPGGSPPDGPGGVPWWAGPVIGGAVGAGLQLIGDEIARMSEPDVNEGSFLFTAPCDVDNNGDPLTQQYNFEKSSFNQRLLNHQIALMDMLQQHLNWKTPTCNAKPKLEGDWVTLRFESDEPSPHSNRAIRKLLRYRSQSGAELGAITDYWRGFTWTTGAVSVQHADAWWGTPQVWAVSADEGKRVLRHVAGEAGIDPDQVGRWIISGSRNPRYGVSLPVKFAQLDGGPWVTQRDVPSGPPLINR